MEVPTRSAKLLAIFALCICQLTIATGQDYYYDEQGYIQDCPVCSWGEEPSIICGKTSKTILLASPPKCTPCRDGFYQRFNFSTGVCKNCTNVRPEGEHWDVKIPCSHKHQGTFECSDGFFEDHNHDCHNCCDKDYVLRKKRIEKCGTYMWKECAEVFLNINHKISSRTTKTKTKQKRNNNSTKPTKAPKSKDGPKENGDNTDQIIYAVLGSIIGLLAVVVCAVYCSKNSSTEVKSSEIASYSCRFTRFFEQVCKTFWSPMESNQNPEPNSPEEVNLIDGITGDGERSHVQLLSEDPVQGVNSVSMSQTVEDEDGDISESSSSVEVHPSFDCAAGKGDSGNDSAIQLSLRDSIQSGSSVSMPHKNVDEVEDFSVSTQDANSVSTSHADDDKVEDISEPSASSSNSSFWSDSPKRTENVKSSVANGKMQVRYQKVFDHSEENIEQENEHGSSDFHLEREEGTRKQDDDKRKMENELIVRMANDLTKRNIKEIKVLYQDIGQGVLEKAEDAIDLLQVLRERGKVTDVSDFCEIFKKIHRSDLVTKYGNP